jgi:hypothetical protein
MVPVGARANEDRLREELQMEYLSKPLIRFQFSLAIVLVRLSPVQVSERWLKGTSGTSM